jgi:tRNA pseudouridine38-40 synthase
MRAAATRFVGHHDFRSFSDDDPSEKSTEVRLEAVALHEDGDLLLIHIEGSHFIWKLVRRLVGVLVEVGRGGLSEVEAAAMLTAASELPARLTAPASGLFLERVYYKGEPRDVPLHPAVVLHSFNR